MEGPRGLKPGEMDSLAELLDLVFRKNSASSLSEDLPQLLSDENRDHLRIIADGGRVVSHVGYMLRDVSILGCTPTVGCIGGVATHPDYRGKGLATRVLHNAFERLRDEGADFVIISGGRGLYLRNGAAPVGRRYEEKIGYEHLKEFDVSGMEVREIKNKEDIPPVADLYEGEPVRFVRPLEDWHFFLKSHMCMNEPSNLFIMCAKGVSAYAVVTEKPIEGCIKVTEFAGDRRLLLGGLFELARERGADGAHLSVMDWDNSMLDLLRKQGCEEKAMNMPGTTRIINFPQLIEKLKPRFETLRVSASEEDDDLILNVGEDTFTYDIAAAAQLIFSEKNVPSILKDALPVPIPWYGLTYA